MAQPKILTDSIGQQLKPVGFKRKSDTWRLVNDDAILIVNLQKSPYGRQYYINIAVWLTEFGDVEFPLEHKCQIRCRWEALMPNVDQQYLEKLLDLEDLSLPEVERSNQIAHCFQSYLLPFFGKIGSAARIAALYRTKDWPRYCDVTYVGQQYLESLH